SFQMEFKGYGDLSEFFFLPQKGEVPSTGSSERSNWHVPFNCSIEWENQLREEEEDIHQMLKDNEPNFYGSPHNECDIEQGKFSGIPNDSLEDSYLLHYKNNETRFLSTSKIASHIDPLLNRKSGLRSHRIEDEYPYSCHLCSKSFNKKWRLSCHMEQVHTKVRNFSCPDCDKKFRSDYDLKRHSTTHTGQRFVCYHCDSGFASKQRVACHIRRSLACWDRKS
ncbi:hypothetical protein PMAYCL1PPCAC_18367, partial [Pristionchus mayeri]